MTVFSAPDYPQFQCSQDERYNNLGAVAVLDSVGDYCQPRMLQYRAAVRPQVNATRHVCEICLKLRSAPAAWSLRDCALQVLLQSVAAAGLHQATTLTCCWSYLWSSATSKASFMPASCADNWLCGMGNMSS